MIRFDKEELLKIAKLSLLQLQDHEVENLVNDIKVLLEYMEELQAVKFATEVQPTKNINIFREDKVIRSNSSDILQLSPKSKDDYFSVPSVFGEKQ